MVKLVKNYVTVTPEGKLSVSMASYLCAKTDFSHALLHNACARPASITMTREPVPPFDATTPYADKNPGAHNESVVVEDPRPPLKAETSPGNLTEGVSPSGDATTNADSTQLSMMTRP